MRSEQTFNDAASITVITVCHNAVGQLEETIRSVLSFSGNRLSYIIIDGESSDGTCEVIERYQEDLAYWISEPDSGIYDAMNKGWAMANAENRILFLGAGDKLLSIPDNIEQYSDRDIIYGDVMIGERRFHSVADYRFRFSNTIHHQALLIPKRLHMEPPFDLKFSVYADYDFSLRLLKMRANYIYDPALIGYAEPGGVSADKQHCENFMVVRKNYGLTVALCSVAFLTFRKLLECIGIRALTP
ncbi:MAG TPA: glycosyltransferase family 2 protein [Desulfuromonadaceae bacterium]